MIFSKAMKTQKPFDGLQCSMNSGPKGTWTLPTYGKEIQFLNCPNLGTNIHSRLNKVFDKAGCVAGLQSALMLPVNPRFECA